MTAIRQMAPRSTTRCAKHYTDGRPVSATQPSASLRLPVMGEGKGKVGAHVLRPKDSNAVVGVRHRTTQKMLKE